MTCARLALAAIERAYPYQLVHVVGGDGEVATPRALHPIFWGAYDWHSAVHGHWTLAAFARRWPDEPLAGEARAALARSLTAAAGAGELAHLARHPHFERPYGLAWVLALHAELAAGAFAAEAAAIDGLARLAADRLATWTGRLSHPVRVGTHAQSAFALALAIDWARATGEPATEAALIAGARRLHGGDRGPMLHLEPSGEDFLSPGLGAAALMARILAPGALAAWLDRALPELALDGGGLAPIAPSDRADGRLVHLDGLAASRAWMADEIAAALPPSDPRVAILEGLAAAHGRAAIDALADQGYAGAHWLGSFALRMLIARAGREGRLVRPMPE